MTVLDTAPARAIRCPKCALMLEAANLVGGGPVECPACRSRLTAFFFPAFEKPHAAVSTASGERALEGEATCYFHPEKRATLACEGCGRFLCMLCDMPLGARHLCPSCLGSDRRSELVIHRICWSRITLALGLLPLIFGWVFFPILVVSGLLAIFTGLWTWKKPGSLVRGSRHWLAVVGIILGVTQLAGVAAFIYMMVMVIRHSHG